MSLLLKFQKVLRDYSLDIDLVVPPGITVLFGKSGAGKSMTLACVAGLTRPDKGVIGINGRFYFHSQQKINLPPQKRKVGFVMQDYLLFPHLTVAENIAFGLTNLSRTQKEQIVHEALSLVGLSNLASQYPAGLSGGQQQRVALARALVMNPQVLLLDEPLSALDGPTRARLRADLRRLVAGLSLPVLLVTHSLTEAYLLADRMAVMANGRLLQIGTPEEVVYHPLNRQVAELTGNRNFFSGQVTSTTTVQVGPLSLETNPLDLPAGSQVLLTIRADRIQLIRKDVPHKPKENLVNGRITTDYTDGFNYTLHIQLDPPYRINPNNHDLEIILPNYIYERLGLAHDRHWQISIPRDAIHILQE
ncbi:MAG: ABC transporter ATP-binding protein [Chloroflexi bacterium]|nr:MAG: ABC transporter ATP-binding protein [Chloroflexota bacterium]